MATTPPTKPYAAIASATVVVPIPTLLKQERQSDLLTKQLANKCTRLLPFGPRSVALTSKHQVEDGGKHEAGGGNSGCTDELQDLVELGNRESHQHHGQTDARANENLGPRKPCTTFLTVLRLSVKGSIT